jgi:hypothetical protein
MVEESLRLIVVGGLTRFRRLEKLAYHAGWFTTVGCCSGSCRWLHGGGNRLGFMPRFQCVSFGDFYF